MTSDALTTFSERVSAAWGPLSSDLVAACRGELSTLLRASPDEPWLAALLRDGPANAELYRQAKAGFVLLAHTEHEGLYRPPHNHGRAWVIYAIQHGEIEIRTFGRVRTGEGDELVQRDSVVMRAGAVQAYLPGDIHDTRCLSGTALLYRFTERDLKVEDRIDRQVTRYAAPRGGWTAASR
jgi:hypothetical protein